MIFYFSGTGNSRFAALTMGKALNEKTCFIPSYIPEKLEFKGSHLGFVFPVYSWGVPSLAEDFISRLSESFCRHVKALEIPIWGIFTCGDDTGMAPEILKHILARRGLEMKGAWSVTMPNTYVLLPGFNVDTPEIRDSKLDAAPGRIDHIVARIKASKWETDVVRGKLPWLKSRIIYPIFRRWGIIPSRWHWTSECIGCELCSAACPTDNIQIRSRHPHWGSNCISCLACYHSCPVHSVGYGNITRTKGQYLCPLSNTKPTPSIPHASPTNRDTGI